MPSAARSELIGSGGGMPPAPRLELVSLGGRDGSGLAETGSGAGRLLLATGNGAGREVLGGWGVVTLPCPVNGRPEKPERGCMADGWGRNWLLVDCGWGVMG